MLDCVPIVVPKHAMPFSHTTEHGIAVHCYELMIHTIGPTGCADSEPASARDSSEACTSKRSTTE